jgi:hypothetical protein
MQDSRQDTVQDSKRDPSRIKVRGMRSIWTQELVRWHGPLKSRMKVLWTMWGLSLALLVLWLSALVYQVPISRWSHLLLAGSFLMMGICVLYSIKYCEFLEPRFMKWVGGSRLRHERQDMPGKAGTADVKDAPSRMEDGEREG